MIRQFSEIFLIVVVLISCPAFGSTDFLVQPGRAAQPMNMVLGPDNNLWFAETTGERIGRITAASKITEFPIRGAQSLVGIASGPDGNIWFTDQLEGKIGHISTTGTNLVQYSLSSGSCPQGITVGPDHNLWFVDQKKNGLFMIGTINTAGKIKEFPTNINAGPLQAESMEYAQITTGPDQNLWFVNPQASLMGLNFLGQITISGTVNTYPLSEAPVALCSGPDGNLWVLEPSQVASVTTSGFEVDYPINSFGFGGMTVGPDKNVWFTEYPTVIAYVIPGTSLVVEFGGDGSFSQILGPSGITSGPDGAMWFVGALSSTVSRITTQGRLTNTYALNHGSAPLWNTLGPDDAVWFTEQLNRIGRISKAGVVTSFPTSKSAAPLGIVAGPDGNLWFTEAGVGAIAKMTTSGTITEYPVLYGLNGIAVGPDGNLWFPNSVTNTIGRITTSGIITDFPVPTPFSGAAYITAGPDNSLWFTETYASQVGKIDPTNGSITEYPLAAGRSPGAITAGPDGNLWFVEDTPFGAVAKITPSGAVTEYTVQVSSPFLEYVNGLVAGPDGALWLPQSYPNSLVRITTSGVISRVSLSTANAGGVALAVGVDHKLWVGESSAGRLGRLSAIGGTGDSIKAVHGTPFEGKVASFVDGTTTAVHCDFIATINWGDGNKSSGKVAGPTGGPFTVSGTHTYSNAGTFKLLVTLTDNVDKSSYHAAPGKASVQ